MHVSGPLALLERVQRRNILCLCFSRLLNVLCCCLDSFLLLESQYSVSSMLLQSQRDNMADGDGYERSHISGHWQTLIY